MIELKPCPACGSEAIITGCGGLRAICKNWDCQMTGPRMYTRKDAITAWNALPRPLRWTNEPPAEPGWYWFRNMHTKGEIYLPQIVHTVQIKGRKPHPADEWAGPIQEPVE